MVAVPDRRDLVHDFISVRKAARPKNRRMEPVKNVLLESRVSSSRTSLGWGKERRIEFS